MKTLQINETKTIIGGGTTNFTGQLFNAFKSVVMTFFEIGQALGGAIRRIGSNKLCNC